MIYFKTETMSSTLILVEKTAINRIPYIYVLVYIFTLGKPSPAFLNYALFTVSPYIMRVGARDTIGQYCDYFIKHSDSLSDL